jgi:hypothetical protein
MLAPLEARAGPDDHVGGSPGSAERPEREIAVAALGRRIIRGDDQEVIVAVGARVIPGLRAEQVDPLGLVRIDQRPDAPAARYFLPPFAPGPA